MSEDTSSTNSPDHVSANRRRLTLWVTVCVITVGMIVLAAWFWQYTFLTARPVSAVVRIEKGESLRSVGRKLVDKGLVPSEMVFRAGVRVYGLDRRIQAGYYELDGMMTLKDLLGELTTGRDRMIQVTIPEGLTCIEIFSLLSQAGLGIPERYRELFDNPGELIPEGFGQPATLEGFLFPDTYRFPETATEQDVIRVMIEQFERAFYRAGENNVATGLNVYQVLILASLVEKETAVDAERPLVASVFLNRLRKGMKLDCDPTVIYALKLEGKWDGNIRKKDLSMDHPYNTYRRRGLPPGPIANPGFASLHAVFHPASTDYLYFVSRNDGTHDFSTTYREHRAKVRTYQVLPFRRSRRRSP